MGKWKKTWSLPLKIYAFEENLGMNYWLAVAMSNRADVISGWNDCRTRARNGCRGASWFKACWYFLRGRDFACQGEGMNCVLVTQEKDKTD